MVRAATGSNPTGWERRRSMQGQRLLHYRILRRLGQGGMGVVYLAHDEKLGRDVALKFLPPQVADDPEERARLLQEARAASMLAHPHLCVIHAIEDAGEQPFIVMEYVPGETLRARLAAGQVTVEQALTWALQIGEALAEAHHRGLVHRDLKSDNIMITPAGRAKLMDFGLARIRDAGSPSHTTTTSGTLAYMAPEQFRSGAIDARSDLYAFGVVLYEMLTGRTPFEASSPAATMYAVLNTEPEPVQSLRPGLPSDLQHVLDRALEKEPADRYQSMDDLLIELKRVQRQLGRATPGAPPPAPAPPLSVPVAGDGLAAAPPPHRRTWRQEIVLTLLAVVATVVALRIARDRPPRIDPHMRFQSLPLPVTDIGYPGMSQDGGWIAFPAADDRGHWGVYFMNVNGSEVRPIVIDSTGVIINYADVSPDGSRIAYQVSDVRTGSPEIRVVPSLGGASIGVASDGLAPHWSPDGTRIGYLVSTARSDSRHLELWSVAPDGSDRGQLYVDSSTARGRISFAWSPDGRKVAWIRSFANGTQELFMVPLGGGRERQLTHDRANIDEVCWTRQHTILFSSNRNGNSNLWVVRERGGPAAQLTKGAGPDIGMRVSADGRHLLYLQSQPFRQLYEAALGSTEGRPTLGNDVNVASFAISPDGRWIAAVVLDPDPIRQVASLALFARDGTGRRALGHDTGVFNAMAWSPDARSVAYAVSPGAADSSQIAVIAADGDATPRRLHPGSVVLWPQPGRLYVADRGRGYWVDPRTGAATITDRDSIYHIPVGAAADTMIAEVRRNRARFVVRDARGADHDVGGPLGVLYADPTFTWAVTPNGPDTLLRTHLTDFTTRAFPMPRGMSTNSPASLTPDGRTVLYGVRRAVSKLVMIDLP